jgi:hypothetical protein
MEVRSLVLKVPEGGETHVLRWETLPAFRDRERPQPWPEPSDLELIELKSENPQ